jgi:succinoglycan biosynthesis transport protein ExoP
MPQQSLLEGREMTRESRSPDTQPASPLEARSLWAKARPFWWLVLVIMMISVGVAAYSTSQQSTTYTGRASLIVNSNNRSPDQDAVLVQGYVDYFNDYAYQTQLAKQAKLADRVTLDARAAAASPILLVESTAATPDVAQSSASAVAEAFKADINKVMDAQRSSQVDDLQKRLDKALESGGADTSAVATLQDQIAQLQDDRTNRLQELQLTGGVSTNSPSRMTNVALGAFGGLVLGLLAAVALGSVVRSKGRGRSTRRRTPRRS